MPIYKTVLRRKEEIADGTMAFHFEKPGAFEFKAGQFGDFTLINPLETDARRQHTGLFVCERALRRHSNVCDSNARHRIQANIKNDGGRYGSFDGRSIRLLHPP